MKRKVLIVEDNKRWRDDLKLLCEEALEELHSDEKMKELYLDSIFGKGKGYAVEVASSLDEAIKFLEEEPLEQGDWPSSPREYFGLATIDINLSDASPGTAEGLNLLGQLVKRAKDINTVIVSAEGSAAYAIEGLQKYRTFRFIQKGRFEDEEFKKVIKAAILYSDAIKLLDTWQWKNAKRALRIWETIQRMKLDPEPLYKRNVEDELTKRVDGVTAKPNANWSNKALQSLLKRDNWALMSITIRGFEDFAATLRGSQHAYHVHKFVAKTLNSAVDELGNPDDFCGHLEGGFVLVSTPDKLDGLQQRIESRFKEQIGLFYDDKDKKRGYMLTDINGEKRRVPLMTLTISRVTHEDGPFESRDDIIELATERKRKMGT